MTHIVVSVVMPSYNSQRFISLSIESVIAQSFTQWELLVVDDCSSDNSVQIIEQYAESDSRIVLIKNSQNSGAAVSRNRAIERAKGRYIAFCDSDDLWDSEKLERQLAFMQSVAAPLTYHNYRVIDPTGEVLGDRRSQGKISYGDLLRQCDIGCLTVMYDTNITGKVYCPQIRKRQDWALWLRITREFGVARGLDECMASYRVGHGSISSSKLKLIKENYRVFRRVEGYGLVVSWLLIIRFLFYYLLRIIRRKMSLV